jgi:hypothetical protein
VFDWIERFLRGRWGIAEGTIHRILDDSKLYIGDKIGKFDDKIYITKEFLETIKRKGAIYRILDHGEPISISYSPDGSKISSGGWVIII